MRSTWVGWLSVAALLVAVGLGESIARVFAQRPTSAAGTTGDSLLSHSMELPDGRQQIALIDGRTRSIAIYQVDPRTGALGLKSVRNVHWDLQMDEYNSGGNPSPKEIRSLLEQR